MCMHAWACVGSVHLCYSARLCVTVMRSSLMLLWSSVLVHMLAGTLVVLLAARVPPPGNHLESWMWLVVLSCGCAACGARACSVLLIALQSRSSYHHVTLEPQDSHVKCEICCGHILTNFDSITH